MCVAQTAIAAREHGHQVTVVVDACAEIDQNPFCALKWAPPACARRSTSDRSADQSPKWSFA
jgi:nicotinamidase-related amidase